MIGQAGPAGAVEIAGVDAHARARLAVGAEREAGARRATSLNVPLRRLRYSLFGCVSLATNRSGQPSWSSSSIATPSDFELVSKMPLVAVTSSKVPLPRLRNSQQVSPR